MGRFEARATGDWDGFGGSVESASGMLATTTAAQVDRRVYRLVDSLLHGHALSWLACAI